MLENKAKKVTASILAASMLNACIAPQQHTWKMESILKTEYKLIDMETQGKDQYQIAATVSETGRLQFQVGIGKYETSYNVVQPMSLEKQREYEFGKSKAGAAVIDTGIGVTALGVVLAATVHETSCSPYNNDFCTEKPTPAIYPIMLGGLLTTGVGWLIYNAPKKERPTKNYREVQVTGQQYQQQEAGTILLQTVPAISTPLEITSSYFGMNGTEHTTITETNIWGNGSLQLVPSSPNFAFTLDGIAETDAAQQIQQAGYAEARYLPLLQEAAAPISYDVTIKTKAVDGKNAEITIPVNGYEVSRKALEQVVMGL